MTFLDYITVFGNIFKNYLFLKSDFIGIGFNPDGFINFILNISFATFLMLIYYLIGKKIRLFFFKENNYKNLNIFINLALGYICVNTGLAVLGMLSLFYPSILWTYIAVIIAVAFYPYAGPAVFKNRMAYFIDIVGKIRKKWVYLGIFLFTAIAFLRLIPAEIGEDANGYHTGDPRLFLKYNTTIIKTITPPYVMPAPHLGEMSYVFSEFIGIRDSSRYIHFSFYILVVIFLTGINPYAGLFFVTAPVVIQISSKANVDFPWILCWLLSAVLITRDKIMRIRTVTLSGVLFGGVLATKLWTIAFLPLFVIFLIINYRKFPLIDRLKISLVFALSALAIELIWLWRSFVIAGNPIYPVFSRITTLGGASGTLIPGNIIGFNNIMFHIQNISVFSPIFYLGILLLLFYWRHGIKVLRNYNLSLFFLFLFAEYLLIQYHFGRYLLGLYSLAVLIISAGVKDVINKLSLARIVFVSVFSVLFLYYFINILFTLPYGLGWADQNKYLTRVIFKDNANYYDFDRKFNKWITDRDRVATYGILGHYYANFNYIDVNFIFDKNNKSFDLLSQKKITKLLIKGGDIQWFCGELNLDNCAAYKIKFLSSYPEGVGSFYLYEMIDVTKIAMGR